LAYRAGALLEGPTVTQRFHAQVLVPSAGRAGRELAETAVATVEGDLVGTDGTEDEQALAPEAVIPEAPAAPKDPDELFRTTYPRLAGWVRRLVDDDDTAHEIASEAFVRLLGRWTKVDNPQSYLYMIATNLVRDHWRKTERERRAIRTVIADEAEPKLAHPAQDVDVRNLLEGLPPRLRDPFLLHYYAGFPLKEVATLLHRPEGTIKADLFAARAKLKTALGDKA
jgi:RNA polymerase sigma-70 factor, ECF subfamily